MRWNHVGIKAADIDRSLRFYCDLLGFERQQEIQVLGKSFFFVGNDSTSIEIEPANPGEQPANPRFQTGMNHLSFTVDDVAALVARLRSAGVPIVLEPFSSRPDRITAFVEDPDGVFIQLLELLPAGRQAVA